MSQQRLTDRSLAPYITGTTLIHIVNTGDTTQYAGGSSYKATIDQVSDYYLNNYDVYITGTTFGSNQAVVTRNDGFDVFKLSGGSNVTLTNPSTNQILIDVTIPPDTNTYVTGGTLVGADLILDWNTGGSVPPIDLSALSGATYWTSGSSGNYSLKTINDSTVDSLGDYTISSGYNNLAVGDYSSIIGGENNTIDNVDKASIIGSNYGIISGSTPSSSEGSSIFGGYSTNLISPSKILEGVASTIVGGFRNNIEYNSISILNGGSLNSIIKSYIPHSPIDNLYNSILGGQLNVIDTGKSDSIIGGRLNKITYNAPLSGFSTGNIIAGGDGNLIDGHSNSAIIGGINNTINFDLISNNGIFVGAGNTITGGGYDSIVGGTGNTINGDPILSADFGNTIIGGRDNTIFTGVTSTIIGGKNNILISNTGPNFRIENSVILGGQNLTGTTDDTVYVPYLNINNLGLGTPINNLGIDSNGFVVVGTSGETDTNTYVTGGTYSAGTATFTNNTGGTFNVTGFTEPFTGNTSGDCINDIYVKNIHSCSPLNINPLDEGNVYFGSTSGITIDLANNRLGVNIDIPTERLHVEGGDLLVKNTNGKFYTNIQNATGPATLLSGNTTSVSRIGVVVPTYDSVTLGVRGPSAGFPGYGKQGDAFIYSSNANNGFNVISQPGTGTDDYIRFFAGQALGAAGTPDLYIQGSGSTRGYVGINTGVPMERLHVQGNGLFSGELTIETINTGTSVYFLAATSGGTVVQGNDLYSEICSYCSDTFSGETLVATGVTEVDSTNTDNSSFSSTTPYDCTQWCIYNSSGAIVTTTSNYLVARDYGDKGFVVRCCDSNSSDGGTDYGTPITGYTPTPGGGPPITVTGITRPVTVKETKKIAFLNSHRSTILNSNQSSISNSTLGIIDLSTLSFIESSFNSKIYNSYFSGILASENGFVKDSGNATIIGSQYSTLSGVTGSTIIGGNNIVGTENDTVYVPKLNISTLGTGTSINNLGIDVNGNVVSGDTTSSVWSAGTGFNSIIANNGTGNVASGAWAVAQGNATTASGNFGSHSEGNATIASGTSAHAEGTQTKAFGASSHAEGWLSLASGNYSHAEGVNTIASGDRSHAEGNGTIASGAVSHAEGISTTASGDYSHAEGRITIAGGNYSHAEGYGSNASGTYSHAEGFITSATTNYTHAEGDKTLASGSASHAEGQQTVASGNNSHSQNEFTAAFGQASHAGGQGFSIGNEVIASGVSSFAHFDISSASGQKGALADYSAILGGQNHEIKTLALRSAILGGSSNVVNPSITDSVVVGGTSITATTSNTVYVPNLNIGTIGGGSPVGNLGFDSSGNVVTGTTGGGGIPEATTATTTNINFTGQTIYYNAGSPGTGNITENLSGAKLGLVQKIYHNDTVEPTYPAGWVLMGDAIYFTSTLNIIYAEWAGGSRVEYWYVQEQ